MLPGCNIDFDCLPNLSAEDYSAITRYDHKLIGPVSTLRTKIKTIMQCDEAIDTMEAVSFNIKNILLTDVRGKGICDFYKKNDKLTEELQDLLIDVVLDHRFNSGREQLMHVDEIEKIVDEMCSCFPNEVKVFPIKITSNL